MEWNYRKVVTGMLMDYPSAWDRTDSGIPWLWETQSVTVRGKAVKLVANKS